MSFYGLVWRLLPGSIAWKVTQALVLVLGVVAVLFTWVFPLVALSMPFNQTTVGP